MNVYLDYAATTPLSAAVLDQMLPLLREHFGNPDSLHAFGRRAAHYVTDSRDRVAAVLGVKPAEVYFTSGGTEADNWAVRCLGRGNAVVSPIEHAAVLSAAQLREGGASVCTAGEDSIVRPSDLEHTMSEATGLVCVMAVNNETGSVQPIGALAALAHARSALFFSDCVQAACTQDLKELLRHADAISLSGHKIGGPKGVGALVVKKGAPLGRLVVGGEQERSLRGGTLNVAGIVGFAYALEAAQRVRGDFCRRTAALRDLFESQLAARLGDVCIDGADRAPNISHVTFARGGEAFLNLLDLNGIACSGGAACSAHAALPSHVMLAIGKSPEEAKRGVRFSFSAETTEEEICYTVDTIVRLLSR